MSALHDPERLDACRRALLRRGGQALVVDDDPDLTGVMETLLDSSGFMVTTAHNVWDAAHLLGLEGTQAARLPDVVILDYKLGRSTGFELLARLRRSDDARGVKVLVLTGTRMELLPDEMRLDADGFLAKPFESVVFLETVAQVLGLDGARP